ncbi:unnamed protein product [Lampetra planeri]
MSRVAGEAGLWSLRTGGGGAISFGERSFFSAPSESARRSQPRGAWPACVRACVIRAAPCRCSVPLTAAQNFIVVVQPLSPAPPLIHHATPRQLR